jgi:hypothetical protein
MDSFFRELNVAGGGGGPVACGTHRQGRKPMSPLRQIADYAAGKLWEVVGRRIDGPGAQHPLEPGQRGDSEGQASPELKRKIGRVPDCRMIDEARRE